MKKNIVKNVAIEAGVLVCEAVKMPLHGVILVGTGVTLGAAAVCNGVNAVENFISKKADKVYNYNDYATE